MVRQQIAGRGIADERVLAAMARVPRHEFLLPEHWLAACDDTPLPIGYGQTISQPYIVALMTEQLGLKRTDRVLEIGTGSGYQSAVLAQVAGVVYSVEIHPELAARAQEALRRVGYANVHVRQGDGYHGWREHAPYDAAIVTCAGHHFPAAVAEQLREGGRAVAPVAEGGGQMLYSYEKRFGELRPSAVVPVLFVPMTGEMEIRPRVFDWQF